MTPSVKIVRGKRSDTRPIRSREKDSSRQRERERLCARLTLGGNSCQSCRPIFHFAPKETRRHLCHKLKTRYVIADHGWSPPYSVSKPFIETISERDLLNPTASFLSYPDFSGGANALSNSWQKKLTKTRI